MSGQIINTYGERELEFNSGQGVWLVEKNGDRWFDALSGIGVNALGHSHPKLSQCIAEQATKLLHISNLYSSDIQQQAATLICHKAEMDALFFCNSGAEANEAALKMARKFGVDKRGVAGKVIYFKGSFHGRTLGALSVTAKEAIRAPFAPLPENTLQADFGDTSEVTELFAQHQDIDAVIIEPIQGESGIRVAPEGFLKFLRTICTQHDALLIIDEVQSGNARTGTWFAYQHEGIKPDIVTTAKGLGGGVPIGATLVANKAHSIFTPGDHGTTFGGNPLAAAAAICVYECIEQESLLARVKQGEKLLRAELKRKLGSHLDAIDGRGYMLAIQLSNPVPQLKTKLGEARLLVNLVSDSRLRILPPLNMTDEEIIELCRRIALVIE